MHDIESVIGFLIEIDKLKNVYRKSKLVGSHRYENSAEHSWHVCLAALMLKDYASESIDINRVIKMLLIHDLCEIDAGDTIIYASQTREQKEKEEAGMKRILGFLSKEDQEMYLALWQEFEEGQTADAKYAKAMDRVIPLLQNINNNGDTWKENDIRKEQVLEINSRIAYGSSILWDIMKSKIEEAIAKGILK